MSRARSVSPSVAHRTLKRLPAFALYGEEGRPALPLLHVESIDSRSRLYDWEIDAHVHHGLHQVIWLRCGHVEAMLDETRTQAEGPVALVIPPGVAHAFRFSPQADGFVLTINAALLTEGEPVAAGAALDELFAQPRTLVLEVAAPAFAHTQRLFEALHAESRSTDGADGPVPLWLARALVWRLACWARRQLQARTHGPGGRHALYTRWVVLLESHYLEHWPVSRYAQRLGLSTERLNRLVRAEAGHNAQRLLHDRLVREACRRLVHVAAPVSSLAFELGFDDPAYFCRFFKRHTGTSPSAYRRQMQSVAA